jgi:murein DD-endopeptidase MepM/ murein hydrolase activator NlpD
MIGLKHKLKKLISSKYLFVIRKEKDFSVLTSFSINAQKITLILLLFFILVFGASLFLARTVLKAWFDPTLSATESTELFIQLSDRVDSLVLELEKREGYVQNIQRIIAGDVLENEEDVITDQDTVPYESGRARNELDRFQPSAGTQAIIEELGGMPFDNNFQFSGTGTPMNNIYLFPPVQGILTAIFDPQNDHFGVDIVAKENEAVKCVLDGTVVFSSWTLATGYVVAVQHSNELISIYKHNSVILKNVGELVRSGEIISIIGNTGELSTGPHLHFELWYQGSALNPQEFISFD